MPAVCGILCHSPITLLVLISCDRVDRTPQQIRQQGLNAVNVIKDAKDDQIINSKPLQQISASVNSALHRSYLSFALILCTDALTNYPLYSPITTHLVMKLPILLPTIAGLLSTAVAAPSDGTRKARFLPNSANCTVSYKVLWDNFSISTTGPWTDSDWGIALLNEVRWRCGIATGWTFIYDDSGNGSAYFALAKIRPGHCVEDSIWWASDPTGAISVTCQG